MSESLSTRLTCPLDEIGDDQSGLVGGKGANLGRLLRLGLPVPPGYVVTTEAYRAFVGANGLSALEPGQLRERILAAPIPPDVATPILASYRRLGSPVTIGGDAALGSASPPVATEPGAGRGTPAVAVRSSGTAEDLATASFAGQHDTFLNVIGEEALLDAVRACWASLWSERAIAYRRQRGWSDGDLALAVVVQAMVPADEAGVLFTADPVTGRRDRIVVESVPGLGEALVSGQVTGRRQVVAKSSRGLLEGDVALPRATLEELVRLGIQIEAAFGAPQDVEWACAAGRCYVLQARPLTALPSDAGPKVSVRPRTYTNLQRRMAPMLLDHVPLPPYPFDYSLFLRPLLEALLRALASLGFAAPSIDEVLVEAADGVYQIVPPAIHPTLRALALPLKLVAALRADPDRWLRESQSGLVALAQRIDAEDLTTLTDRELLDRVEALSRLQIEVAGPRFGCVPKGLLLSQALSLLLRQAAGRDAPALEADLLAAIPCVTTHANQELRRLASQIRASAELRAVFLATRPEQLPARLGESAAGQEITAEVAGFLRRYGLRETTMISAAFPAWRDDPAVVYGLLKSLAAGAASESPESETERVDVARSAVIALLSRRWLGLGKRVIPLLLRLVAETRSFVAFREDSHYGLVMPLAVTRRLALELGRRLTERGVLTEEADVFFLRIDELRDLAPPAMTETVQRRRAARRSLAGHLTAVPAELLDPTNASGEVRGTPVSAGQVIGVVRIILDERDFWKLQSGEVLVAPYTNPTWTSLFALAGAVVVDAGGTASHAAIVAREYGIPAVMGTGNATARLQDGQRVLVDGEAGRVVRIGTDD